MLKSLASFAFSLAGGAALALGANAVRGEYIEARTADVYTGACFANSEVGSVGQFAVLGWRIAKGTFDGVALDGLSVVGVLRANSTLGDIHSPVYPVKSVLIVDERATPEQRLALQAFARRMGGDLFQNVVRVESAPIAFEVKDNNVHLATARMTAGTLARIETRGVHKGDLVCAHEEVWYQPLTKVGHAMPAVTVAHDFKGQGLDSRWSSPDKRSAFVADFQLND